MGKQPKVKDTNDNADFETTLWGLNIVIVLFLKISAVKISMLMQEINFYSWMALNTEFWHETLDGAVR